MSSHYEISGEDLRAALKEMKTYVDVTEEDLMKIYGIALKHAKARVALESSVSDVMNKNVIAVKKDADIHEVARLLSEKRISGLPVVDDENRVIGVVSEADILLMAGMKREHTFKDIVRHLLGEPLPRHKTGDRVEEIMTSPPITIRPDASTLEVAGILEERRIKRLPVVDERGRLTGIVSRGDIVRVMGGKH